ncbi:hypothetical protein H6G97_50995, partial [Nostoc flagelliforme FACHB-838]|nr:hypothetical protein [Nostoc flagelliforme FACHB-838]
MDENCLAYGIEISDSDWEKTPASIKQLVEKMGQHIKQSEKRLAELEVKYQELLEKINCTSKAQGNVDGCNHKNSQGWLGVAVTPLVTFFEIALSRCSDAARNLLGENFSGILNSDR